MNGPRSVQNVVRGMKLPPGYNHEAIKQLVDITDAEEVEIERLRSGLLEIRRRLVEMPGVTCGMSDVIDHALGSVCATPGGGSKSG